MGGIWLVAHGGSLSGFISRIRQSNAICAYKILDHSLVTKLFPYPEDAVMRFMLALFSFVSGPFTNSELRGSWWTANEGRLMVSPAKFRPFLLLPKRC